VSQQFLLAPRWIGDPYRKDGLHEFDLLPGDKAERVQETAVNLKAKPGKI